LAALVPRPRTHLLTHHGVLAPAAAWGDWVVPRTGDGTRGASAECCTHADPSLGSPGASEPSARLTRRIQRPIRHSWAELLKRVFEIDVLVRPHCGAARKLIAGPSSGWQRTCAMQRARR
jgi:hypothetical protein